MPESHMGDLATWKKAEAALKEALIEFGKPWEVRLLDTLNARKHLADSSFGSYDILTDSPTQPYHLGQPQRASSLFIFGSVG